MEAKKSKEANLENKRLGFFFIGLVMIGSFVGMAINFTQAYIDPYVEKIAQKKVEEEVIFEIQEEEKPEEIEPESAPPPPMIETIEIVPDDVEVPEIDFTTLDEEPEEIIIDKPDEAIVDEPILDIAEVEPSFPGGPAAMTAWIQKEVKYPELASEMGEQGIVYVKFVVNKDGSIEQVSIRKGVSDALDKEAIRVVKAMPKWAPGEQAGKPVRVSFTLPISFKLG
jgi:protein TonB